MNKVITMGRLVKDPEIRKTQAGKSVANFTLAVNKKYTGQNGEKQVDYINIVAWNNQAEFVNKFFKKGLQVSVIGRLETRSYTGSDGVKRYSTEVIAEELYFADSKKQEGAN